MSKKKVLRPLKIKARCISAGPEIIENIKYAMSLRLPEIFPAPLAHDGTVALVGAGPTVKNHLEDIKRHQEHGQPVVSIKGSHDWLIEQGIIPNACTAVDPQNNQMRYFHKKDKRVTYMLASQCHKDFLDHFVHDEPKVPVLLWHCFADVGEKEIIKNRPLVLGGTTSGLRTLYLMYMLGFRQFHLYGFDSCGNTGVSGHISHEKMIEVYAGTKGPYYATPAMVKQAEEMQMILRQLKDVNMSIHGESFMSAVISELIRKSQEAQREHDNKLSSKTGPEQGIEPIPDHHPEP